MGTESSKRILRSGEGEVIKLGPPATGEVTIKVDARRAGSAFAMGTETLLPGGAIPVHRHLFQDEVLFVHKGQGRATLDGKAMTVLPGTVVYVPRQGWHGLRNTGTGILQITWTVVPPGIEEFFREASRLGASADAAALQEVAKRHGIELSAGGEPPRARVQGPAGRAHRRRHRGRRGRGGFGQSPQGPPPPEHPSTSLTTSAPAQAQRPQVRGAPGDRQPRGSRKDRPQRVREVYMGGRWVRVTGEGPVIAPGKEHQKMS